MSSPFPAQVIMIIDIAGYYLDLPDTRNASRPFLRLLRSLYEDTREAARERDQKYQALITDPPNLQWINSKITNAVDVLLSFCQSLQGISPADNTELKLGLRFRSMLADPRKYEPAYAMLLPCHSALLTALNQLKNSPMGPVSSTVNNSSRRQFSARSAPSCPDQKEYLDNLDFRKARSKSLMRARGTAGGSGPGVQLSRSPGSSISTTSTSSSLPSYRTFSSNVQPVSAQHYESPVSPLAPMTSETDTNISPQTSNSPPPLPALGTVHSDTGNPIENLPHEMSQDNSIIELPHSEIFELSPQEPPAEMLASLPEEFPAPETQLASNPPRPYKGTIPDIRITMATPQPSDRQVSRAWIPVPSKPPVPRRSLRRDGLNI